MTIIRYAFWALVALCLVLVGLANRGMVTLRLMPESIGALVGISPDIQLPLFVVIFLGVAAGLLIGFLWEWVREHKIRVEAREKAREVVLLQREVGRLKTRETEGGGDEVLALLDQGPARR